MGKLCYYAIILLVEKKLIIIYFNNKNITGVDAKEYMNILAKGLITISNKTCMRDFSQGVYRMRNILDSQSIDLIFDNEFLIPSLSVSPKISNVFLLRASPSSFAILEILSSITRYLIK